MVYLSRAVAKIQIKRIDKALQMYKLKNREFPEFLERLIEGKNPFLKMKDLYDPWEQHYQYDPSGQRNRGKMPDVWTRYPERENIGNWPELD